MTQSKDRRSSEVKKVSYFYLKPSDSLFQLKLPRNKCILERFFGLQDEMNYEPKRNIASKIYDEIIPIYNKEKTEVY